MVNLTPQCVAREINLYGDTITLRVVTDDSYSKWGDADESTADTTGIKATVNILTQSDDLVKEGIFQSGDKVFWIGGTQTNLDRGNRIQHDSKWYEINEILENFLGNTNFIYEVRTKKI